MEPTSPDKYYIVSGKVEVDGKKGKGKIKKWWDEEEKEFKEKVLAFEETK